LKREKIHPPKLPAVSEQMKAWSAALRDEVSGWAQVEARSFFGFTALYRKDLMFAALPRTRALETANSLVFKIENPTANLLDRLKSDPRIGSMSMQKARWFLFALSADADLHDALDWLGRAYDAASKPAKQKKRR
jgi:TfoX/Sxy family transcriptional regulator of competence genes